METQIAKNGAGLKRFSFGAAEVDPIDYMSNRFSREDILSAFDKIIEFKNFFQENNAVKLKAGSEPPGTEVSKKSFLVFKNHKYFTVPTENIAFFCVKYESTVIVCFDNQEYFVSHSMEHIQNLLTDKDFYRLNRQYLINFNAVKEVEHYFARKLLVNLTVPTKDQLLVTKEKVSSFLHWLDNR